VPALVPFGTATVSVVLFVPPAVSLRLLSANDAVGPEGETVDARPTVPAKLFTLPMVTVDVWEEPAGMVRELGTDAIVKSTTFSVSESADDTPPLSVTVTFTR